MNINKEYLDTKLRCPISGKDIIVRFIPEALYNRYYEIYPFIFEEELIIEEPIVSETKK